MPNSALAHSKPSSANGGGPGRTTRRWPTASACWCWMGASRSTRGCPRSATSPTRLELSRTTVTAAYRELREAGFVGESARVGDADAAARPGTRSGAGAGRRTARLQQGGPAGRDEPGRGGAGGGRRAAPLPGRLRLRPGRTAAPARSRSRNATGCAACPPSRADPRDRRRPAGDRAHRADLPQPRRPRAHRDADLPARLRGAAVGRGAAGAGDRRAGRRGGAGGGGARCRRCRARRLGSGDDGWDSDAIEQAIARSNPTLAYVIPDFHNPTGASMSATTRERLLAAAAGHGMIVVADETTADLDIDRVGDVRSARDVRPEAGRGRAGHPHRFGQQEPVGRAADRLDPRRAADDPQTDRCEAGQRPRHADPRAARRGADASRHGVDRRGAARAAARGARTGADARGRALPRLDDARPRRRPGRLGRDRRADQLAARARRPQQRAVHHGRPAIRPRRGLRALPAHPDHVLAPARRRGRSTRSPPPGRPCCATPSPTPATSPTSSDARRARPPRPVDSALVVARSPPSVRQRVPSQRLRGGEPGACG